MSQIEWYNFWRRMVCLSSMRRIPFTRPSTEDNIDCGYCLDRYLTVEPQ